MRIRNQFSIYKGLPKPVYVLFASRVINTMGSFIMPLMTLILTQKIGLSKPDAGLFSTIAIVSQAPFLILGGKLVDKIGGRKVIVLFNTLGALIYFACGLQKPTIPVAVMIVIASDLYSMASPAYMSLVAEKTPRQSLNSAYSLLYFGINLGLTVGPAVAGILFDSYLNLLFILDGLTTLAATALVFLLIRDGGALPAGEGEADEDKVSGKSSVFSFFRANPILPVFALLMLVYHFCYIQWNFMLPLQLTDLFRVDGTETYSLCFSMNAITVIVLTPLLTCTMQKIHPLLTVGLGGIFYAAAFALFSVNGPKILFAAAIVIMTTGEILGAISTNSFIALRTPRACIGRVNSLLMLINGVGNAVGPVIMGNALLSLDYRRAWLVISAIVLGAAFLTMFARKYDTAFSSCDG